MLPLDIAHPLPRAEAAPECVLAHCSPARRGLFVFLAKPSRAVDPLAGRGTGRVDAASCKRVGRPRGFSHETESLPRSSVRLRRDHDERLLRLDLQHTALLGAVQLSRRGDAEPVADARRRDWWNGTWWTRSGRAATCGRCATGNGGCTRPKPPRKSSIVTTRYGWGRGDLQRESAEDVGAGAHGRYRQRRRQRGAQSCCGRVFVSTGIDGAVVKKDMVL
jgi:hypothetical protein